MFCPNNYVLLSELVDEMKLDIGELPEPVTSTAEFFADVDALKRAFVNWLLLALFKSLGDKLRVSTPAGATLRLSAEVLQPIVPKFSDAIEVRWDGKFPSESVKDLRELSKSPFFKFLDPDYLCISVDDGRSNTPLHLLNRYPLCIAKDELPKGNPRLAPWLLDEMQRSFDPNFTGHFGTEDEEALIATLIQAYVDGEVRDKPSAKAMFAPNMKHESWKEIWALASKKYPEMAKSGPR